MRSPWILRLLALLGLLLSGYLLGLKLTGRISYLVGCGAGSGCENVLGSRWSQFYYIPVTAFAVGMYALLLVATWKPSRPLCAGLAIGLGGAALWFYGILIFELKAFCPWCTAAHAIGLICAVLLARTLKKEEGLQGSSRLGLVAGAMGIAGLVLGQIFGPVPDTHVVVEETVEQEDKSVAVHARGKGRVVNLMSDKKFYNTTSLPHLGPDTAPHVLVKYFDFTCSSCLDMHHDLEFVVQKHPGQFCVIMLPVPLNRACNEFFPTHVENHEHACEMARLGLAAWRAKPEAYPEVHETLFTRPVLDPEIAEIAVAQIVGEEALAEAMQDPWIEEILTANKNDFRQLITSTIKMPKLLVADNKMLHGVTKSKEVLLRALEKEFNLPPAP